MSSFEQKIVVTGLACIHPMGKSITSCIDYLERAPLENASCSWKDHCFGEHAVGRLADDEFDKNLTSMEKRSFDRITKVVCDTVGRCIEDAQLEGQADMLAATGIISGSAFGCLESQDRLLKVLHEKGPSYLDPVEFPLTSHNFPISAASIKYGLKGPITAMIASMSAGLNALVYSAVQILKGQSPRMMVVAFDEINELQHAYLNEKKYLDCANQVGPVHTHKPIYPSESCVAWMLELEKSARQRKARIYGRLGNWHIAAGNFNPADTVHLQRGIAAVMANGASERSQEVIFVANGSGIAQDDEAENQALANLAEAGITFHSQIRLKPSIGNCLGAASLMEGALLLHQQHHRDRCKGVSAAVASPAFLLNSFGMGGNLISLTAQSVSPDVEPMDRQISGR